MLTRRRNDEKSEKQNFNVNKCAPAIISHAGYRNYNSRTKRKRRRQKNIGKINDNKI
jgi:hypothetical protein